MSLRLKYPYRVTVTTDNLSGIFEWFADQHQIADEHYSFYVSNDVKIFNFTTKGVALAFQIRWGGVHV